MRMYYDRYKHYFVEVPYVGIQNPPFLLCALKQREPLQSKTRIFAEGSLKVINACPLYSEFGFPLHGSLNSVLAYMPFTFLFKVVRYIYYNTQAGWKSSGIKIEKILNYYILFCCSQSALG
jgi:hypothetical protein